MISRLPLRAFGLVGLGLLCLGAGCGGKKGRDLGGAAGDAGPWRTVDAGPPPSAAIDEAHRAIKATALEVERLLRDGRAAAAKPRCELALEVVADDILAASRAEATAALAKLTEVCEGKVFPAALAADLAAIQRAERAGDGATVGYLCEKDRLIHERTRTRKDAAQFAAACAAAWTRPLP